MWGLNGFNSTEQPFISAVSLFFFFFHQRSFFYSSQAWIHLCPYARTLWTRLDFFPHDGGIKTNMFSKASVAELRVTLASPQNYELPSCQNRCERDQRRVSIESRVLVFVAVKASRPNTQGVINVPHLSACPGKERTKKEKQKKHNRMKSSRGKCVQTKHKPTAWC